MKIGNLPKSCKALLLSAIRKGFCRSKTYQEAILKARVEKPRVLKSGKIGLIPQVFYKCAGCGELFKRTQVQLDHIDSVVPIAKSTNDMFIEEYVSRVYCDINNLQVLCKKKCHRKKSNKENSQR